MPDFIIIGAAKSGTTSLAQYLGQHPQIHMSRLKEARFLGYPDGLPTYKGYGARGSEIMRIYRETIPTTLEGYEALFDGATSSQITGEASPAYLYLDGAAANIKRLYPKVKIIAILRDPVKRAYSSYLHMRREDAENLSFADALLAEKRRISEGAGLPYHYASMGYYTKQLEQYYSVFDRSQISVLFYEDFARKPTATLSAICSFLDIPPGFTFDCTQKRNVSGIPVNRGIFQAFNRFKVSFLPRSLKKILPSAIRTGLNQAATNQLLKKPTMGENEFRHLAELYREDVRNLGTLTGTPPPWKLG
jgi:hypothetical protein